MLPVESVNQKPLVGAGTETPGQKEARSTACCQSKPRIIVVLNDYVNASDACRQYDAP